MLTLTILALIVALIAPQATAQDSPVTGPPPVVTRVSGCTDIGSVTTDCVRPVTLTLYGSGFMTGIEDDQWAAYYVQVFIDRPNTGTYAGWSDCRTDLAAPVANDTYLECTVDNYGYGWFDTNVLLNISVTNYRLSVSSAPFAGLEFRYLPPPHIDRVSGCATVSADGQTVYGCRPDIHFLTLTGSGFSSLNNTWARLNLAHQHWPQRIGSGFQTYDLVEYSDTVMVLTFAYNYHWLVELASYGGQPLPFNLSDYTVNTDSFESVWSTNTVYIQFAPLPSPNITSIVVWPVFGDGCQWNNATNRYERCQPGGSMLQFSGHFLYPPATVLVGGVEAPVTPLQGTVMLVMATLPLFAFTPNRPYDLTVNTLGGSITFPNYIVFDSTPFISSISVCEESYTGGAFFLSPLKCYAGQSITLSVFNFNTNSVPSIEMRSSQNATSQCGQVRYVDANTLTCVLPTALPDPSGIGLTFQALWADGSRSATSAAYTVYDWPNAPRITGLSGCYSSNQCLSGEIITLTGRQFSNHNWTAYLGYPSFDLCHSVIVVNDNTLTCQLPVVEDSAYLLYDTEYKIFIYSYDWDEMHELTSNVVRVTFVERVSATEPGSGSGSTSTTTIVLATVFSVVGALLLLVAAVYIYRRYVSGKPTRSGGGESFASGSSDTMSADVRHVELAEV